jgi:hypothetical protein
MTAAEYDKWNIMGRNGCRFSNDKKHRKQIAEKV